MSRGFGSSVLCLALAVLASTTLVSACSDSDKTTGGHATAGAAGESGEGGGGDTAAGSGGASGSDGRTPRHGLPECESPRFDPVDQVTVCANGFRHRARPSVCGVVAQSLGAGGAAGSDSGESAAGTSNAGESAGAAGGSNGLGFGNDCASDDDCAPGSACMPDRGDAGRSCRARPFASGWPRSHRWSTFAISADRWPRLRSPRRSARRNQCLRRRRLYRFRRRR